MKKNVLIFSCTLAAICLVHESGFADAFKDMQGNDLFSGKLDHEVGTMVKTLFGYPTKIAGVLAGSYGMLQSYVAASPKPVMMWGAISLLTFFMPKILTALFGL